MARYRAAVLRKKSPKSINGLKYNESAECIPSEHVEQRNFVQWFRQNYDPVRIFAIPNGGKRSKKVAMELKAEGLSAGVPDLFIPEWGLWIEMKRTKNSSTSTDQKDWLQYLSSIGYIVRVCKGCDAAKKAVIEFVLDYPLFRPAPLADRSPDSSDPA